jgi:hypothetical protein
MWPAPIRASATLNSAVPRDFIWRAFESAPRWPEVLKDLSSATIEPDGRLAAGAVMRSQAVPGTMAVDMAYRVLEAEAPARLVTVSEANGFTARTAYGFAPAADGGTDLTLTAEVTAQKLPVRLYVAIQRDKHVQMVQGSLIRRMSAMLELAERIWREQAGPAGPAP